MTRVWSSVARVVSSYSCPSSAGYDPDRLEGPIVVAHNLIPTGHRVAPAMSIVSTRTFCRTKLITLRNNEQGQQRSTRLTTVVLGHATLSTSYSRYVLGKQLPFQGGCRLDRC